MRNFQRSTWRYLYHPVARPWGVLVLVLALAYGGGLWLHLLHEGAGATEFDAPLPVLHWLRDSTLLLPLVLGSVIAALFVTQQLLKRFNRNPSSFLGTVLAPLTVAIITSATLAAASPIHTTLFQAHHQFGAEELALDVHMLYDGLMAFGVNALIARIVFALLGKRLWATRRQRATRVYRLTTLPRLAAAGMLALILAADLASWLGGPTFVTPVAAAERPPPTRGMRIARVNMLLMSDAKLLHEFFRFDLRVHIIHADQDQPPIFVLEPRGLQQRGFFATGNAPRRPKVDDDGSAAQSRQTNRLTVEGFDFKIGRCAAGERAGGALTYSERKHAEQPHNNQRNCAKDQDASAFRRTRRKRWRDFHGYFISLCDLDIDCRENAMRTIAPSGGRGGTQNGGGRGDAPNGASKTRYSAIFFSPSSSTLKLEGPNVTRLTQSL